MPPVTEPGEDPAPTHGQAPATVRTGEPINGDSDTWLLAGATVIDGAVSRPRRSDVLVTGSTVGGVGHFDHTAVDYVIDASDRWVVPGLIDSHIHTTDLAEMPAYVRVGVTSVRYAGTKPGAIAALRSRIRDASVAAPKIYTCGPMIDGPGGNYPELSRTVHSAEEARDVAEALVTEDGVDALLVVQQMTRELAGAVADVSRATGTPVFGQIWRIDGEEAGAVGITQLENTSRVLESAVFGSLEVRFNDRIRQLRDGWANIDWNRTNRLIDSMIDRQVAYCPTLIRTLWATGMAPGNALSLRDHPAFGDFPEKLVTAWETRAGAMLNDPDLADSTTWPRAVENLRTWVLEFHQRGGRVVAGSDTPLGAVSYHEELSCLASSGLSSMAVLQAATAHAGAQLARNTKVGKLSRGYAADLLVLGRDPLQDLSALLTPDAVVIDGRLVHGRLSDGHHPRRNPKAQTTEATNE